MHDFIYFIFDCTIFCCSTPLPTCSMGSKLQFCFLVCHFNLPLYVSSFLQGGDPSGERNYSLEVISFKSCLVFKIRIQCCVIWIFLSFILLFAFSQFLVLSWCFFFHLLIEEMWKMKWMKRYSGFYKNTKCVMW